MASGDTAAAPGAERAPGGRPARAAPSGARSLAPLAFAAFLACFFAPALFGPEQFLSHDNGRMHVPVKRFVAEELRRGHVPQWNPYSGLGAPLVAGAVNAVQHPFNLLLVTLPFDLAFKLWIVLCYWVAATGTWAWARRLGCGPAGAFAAGLAFALSGFLVSSSDNVTYLSSAAAIPWVFAAAHAWIAHGGATRLALVGCASALCAAAGDPQGWGLAVAALPLYAVLLARREGLGAFGALGRGGAAALAGVVAAAPFVLPVVAFVPHSSRVDVLGPAELLRWNLHPLRLAELALPNLLRGPRELLYSDVFQTYAGDALNLRPWLASVYVGASVLALAAAGALRCRAARILAAGAAVATWMAMGPFAGYATLSRHLPALANFRYGEKLVVWPSLLLALAAGLGVATVAEGGRPARRLGVALGVLGAAAVVAAAALAALPGAAQRLVLRAPGAEDAARVLLGNLAEGLVASGVAALALGLVAWVRARGQAPRLAPALAVVIVGLDVAGANVGAYVLSPAEVARPRSRLVDHLAAQPGLQRVVTPFPLPEDRRPDLTRVDATWLWGAQTLAPAWNVGSRVGNFESYEPLLPLRADRHRRRLQGVRQVPTLGMWSVGYEVVPGKTSGEPAVALSPAREIAASDPAMPAFLVRLPHRERAYLARELLSVDRRRAMEFVLDDASAASDRSVVEGPVPPDYARPEGEARIVVDRPEEVVVEAHSDRPALLVLNDAFTEGWSATLDGQTAEILPANYLVRGVWIGEGTHRVAFRYRTPLLVEGWAIAGAGALALGAYGWCRRRRGATA